jgi:hypothetical protein
MKIHVAIKRLILCPIFLACLWATDAGALTCLARSKTVVIDADWQIDGSYFYEFDISNPEDALKIDRLVQQLSARTDKGSAYSATVRQPDGRETPWAAMDRNHTPQGASVKIVLAVSKAFPGFEGLFADTMRIDQAAPIKKAAYHIRFPEKTEFACQLIVRDEKGDHYRQNKSYADEFSWSGDNIRRLDLTISTATSWDQIRDRYQALFQGRIGEELIDPADLPGLSTEIDCARPDDQKIQDVMNYFKTHFDYQQQDGQHHGLLPDDPAAVMLRGWSDCKDIALLQSLILRRMDIDAFVVLSGTPAGERSESPLPDPFIFDHAMVGTNTSGRIAYYDALTPKNSVAANDQNIYLHLKVSCDAQ